MIESAVENVEAVRGRDVAKIEYKEGSWRSLWGQGRQESQDLYGESSDDVFVKDNVTMARGPLCLCAFP